MLGVVLACCGEEYGDEVDMTASPIGSYDTSGEDCGVLSLLRNSCTLYIY